ncbi:MAG TPA: hypothetical protein DEA97_07755 [Bacteroidales bacterium]|nr:hypothetical protein [Bacteroidales bacterium]
MKKNKRIVCILTIICFLCITSMTAQNIKLYSIGIDASRGDNKVMFCKIDPVTASVTLIAQLNDVKSVNSGSSTFDQNSHHYIFSGHDVNNITRLYSIDTLGKVVSNPVINNAFVFGLEYDLKSNHLYCEINNTFLGIRSFGSFNIEKGVTEDINNLDNVLGMASGSSAFNSNTGKYIFYGPDNNNVKRIWSINSVDGVIETSQIVDSFFVSELEFDNLNNKLIGIYRNNTDLSKLFLAEINYLTAEVSIICNLDDVTTLQTGSSVFDQSTGSYIFKGRDIFNNNKLFLINALTGEKISNIITDNFFYEIECDNTKFAKSFYESTDLNMENTIDNLSVYPNPNSGFFNLSFSSRAPTVVKIQVINNLGQIIYNESLDSFIGGYSKNIDISAFGSGKYFLKLSMNEQTKIEQITVIK